MTLSDLLAYLRARNGGVYYSDIAEATGIPSLHLVRAERTYTVANLTRDEIERLASFFGVTTEELLQAQKRVRSDLTAYVAAQEKDGLPIHLCLVSGATVSGQLAWRDRHAIALRQPDQSTVVVYRSNVTSW